jgi:hypothetical protein
MNLKLMVGPMALLAIAAEGSSAIQGLLRNHALVDVRGLVRVLRQQGVSRPDPFGTEYPFVSSMWPHE